MPRKVFSAFLHLDERAGLPDAVGERRTSIAARLHAFFEYCAGLKNAVVTERTEEVVKEDLCLALLVALDMRADPLDELGKLLTAKFFHPEPQMTKG